MVYIFTQLNVAALFLLPTESSLLCRESDQISWFLMPLIRGCSSRVLTRADVVDLYFEDLPGWSSL